MRSSYTFDPLATSFSLLKKTKKFLFFSFKISRGHLPSVSAPKCGLICQKFLSKDAAFDEGHLQEERQPFLKNYWRSFLCIQRLTFKLLKEELFASVVESNWPRVPGSIEELTVEGRVIALNCEPLGQGKIFTNYWVKRYVFIFIFCRNYKFSL